MIKINPVTMYYAIGTIPNFRKHKSILLDFFDKAEGYPLDIDSQDISKTDWKVPREVKRNYMDYFLEITVPIYKQITEELSYGEFKIDNVWFQQYYHNKYHEWHIHPETHMSNILYVEVPENHVRQLLKKYLQNLSSDEIRVIEELIKIMRKNNPMWGL